MVMSVMWKPVRNDGKSCGSGSRFQSQIERAFGRFPVTLDNEDIEKLNAMEAVSGEGVYGKLADAIREHNEIEVYGEY